MTNSKVFLLAFIALLAFTASLVFAAPSLRQWTGTAPNMPLKVVVSNGELIVTDPSNDQYKYYSPQYNWPIPSDLDILEARVYSDGQNIYVRYKFQTLKSKYSPYVMLVMDFTPDNNMDGFDNWLPDWSDTKLPWKWDAIIGVNLGKKDSQPFVFYRSWNPQFVGSLAVDQDNAVIEAMVPLSALPDFPRNGKIRMVIVVFANDYGGIWDPGKKKNYDPEIGIVINEETFYACNVYDIAGQAPTNMEVYGNWKDGVQEVAVYYTVSTSNGIFTSVADYGRKVSYERSLAKMKLIYPPLPGQLRNWAGTPPLTSPGSTVVSNEAIITDPSNDQYKYYRPDWNWPITSDLDVLETRLYSDGQYLYIRVKLSTLKNKYSPYIMIPIDYTPDNPSDGFDNWLPGFSDTNLPWKWDVIIGINFGKSETQPFVFNHAWDPTFTGQLAVNQTQGVIEAKIPLSSLPGFPTNGKIKYTVIIFANSFGGVWDPGQNNAVDPSTGKTISENDYASDVYDIAGQAPTSAEVYGGWGNGSQTVKTAFTAQLTNGLFVGIMPA
jgi:hypothetical protein